MQFVALPDEVDILAFQLILKEHGIQCGTRTVFFFFYKHIYLEAADLFGGSV